MKLHEVMEEYKEVNKCFIGNDYWSKKIEDAYNEDMKANLVQPEVMPNEVVAGGQVDKLLTEILEANKKYMDSTGWCSNCRSNNCPHSYKTDLLTHIKNKLGLKCEPA